MLGQDEINKQYAQISHAFIMTVDALEDSDLKAIIPPPPPPVEEIPPRQPEEKKTRHKEERPKAEAKADKSFAAAHVHASEPPKRDAYPPVAVPTPMANRKYQVIGVVVLTIAAVAIWASLVTVPAGWAGPPKQAPAFSPDF